MIEKVTIENFQSHKDTVLEFDPGVNVITGDTDTGKSAIIRALRFNIYNQPTGEEFRSTWGGDTKVVIDYDNARITRLKGKENLYILNNKELRSFKTNVPDEVKIAANMDDVNLQQQHDSIFLISDTEGEVAKHFNKIAKIDKVDEANKKINSEYHKVNHTIEINKADLEEKEAELATYQYLEEAEALLKVIEELEVESTKLKNKRKDLKKLLTQLEEVELELSSIPELKYEYRVNELLELHTENLNFEYQIDSIGLYIEQFLELEKRIDQQESLKYLEQKINNILKLHSESEETSKKQTKLSDLIKTISKLENKQETAKIDLAELEKKFEKHMTVCPLCNTKLK